MSEKKKYSEEVKELVIQRIKAMPPSIKLCFGDGIKLSKKEMIDLINSKDELGAEIIEMHLEYLRAIKTMVV